ncbi:TIGR02757 family protein [Arsenicibacter rosenii]|uniref:TIGR02757 family protein n=1 Tax=Arsenicibacter rosenii TaxID=1750698 RepID=A0A1S2VPX0_9BACT|nr:TIGR02757 family protein [Arsenicibacter rosenii]OIN60802.1 TIGR02757 family protein [Arsenicibacter rosenii]
MSFIPEQIVELLLQKVSQYNQPAFIDKDPVSIPHQFTLKQDIEIMGFWAAILAWGQRPVILKKSQELISRMDGAPYDFIRNHQERDLKRFLDFKHRTFNATDALYFLHFFRQYYQQHDSLEEAFLPDAVNTATVEPHLILFHDRFCGGYDLDNSYFPDRTRKHIATPARNSTCKRLLMFLRWMVRQDNAGVDFGIWTRIQPRQLVMPIDVHVGRVARTLGLLSREQSDWKAALELTDVLRQIDADDPVKFDFALFGAGVEGEF